MHVSATQRKCLLQAAMVHSCSLLTNRVSDPRCAPSKELRAGKCRDTVTGSRERTTLTTPIIGRGSMASSSQTQATSSDSAYSVKQSYADKCLTAGFLEKLCVCVHVCWLSNQFSQEVSIWLTHEFRFTINVSIFIYTDDCDKREISENLSAFLRVINNLTKVVKTAWWTEARQGVCLTWYSHGRGSGGS